MTTHSIHNLTRRPDNWRRNPSHLFWQGCVFFGGGQAPGGSKLYDGSVFGNTGTLTHMSPAADWLWSDYLGRWCLDFDGSDDCVATKLTNISNAVISCAGWINVPNGDSAVFNGSSEHASYLYLAHVWPQGELNGGYIYMGDGDNYSSHALSVDDIDIKDGWHYVTYVRQQANGWGYIDGQLGGTKNNWSLSAECPVIYLSNGGSYRNMEGQLCDSTIHSRPLSPTEISELADPGNVMLSGAILPPRRVWWPVGGTAGVSFGGTSKILGGGICA